MRVALLATILIATTAGAAFALDVTFARVADSTGPFLPHDVRPAFHDRHVAFRGELDGETGLFRKDVLTGELVAVALNSDPVPNDPGQSFENIDWPAIYQGEVIFTGGRTREVTTGMFAGVGVGVDVVMDRQSWFPSVGAEGIAFRDDESAVTNPGAWFLPAGSSMPIAILQWGDLLPSGDTFHNCNVGESPALGGDQIVFSARAHPEGALMRYDVATSSLHTVWDHRSNFPGTSEPIVHFAQVDTDGQVIAAVAQTDFGENTGVFAIDVDDAPADGGIPVMIARDGDPVPGTSATLFNSFGKVGVDAGHVVFEAFFGAGVKGLFAWDGAEITRIALPGDVIDGVTVGAPDFNHRGLDGNRFVCRIQPSGSFDYVYFLVTLGAVVSTPDADVASSPNLVVRRNPLRVDGRVSVRSDVPVSLRAFDVAGRRVGPIVELRPSGGWADAWWHELAPGAPAGTYFVNRVGAAAADAVRLVVLR